MKQLLLDHWLKSFYHVLRKVKLAVDITLTIAPFLTASSCQQVQTTIWWFYSQLVIKRLYGSFILPTNVELNLIRFGLSSFEEKHIMSTNMANTMR